VISIKCSILVSLLIYY